MLNINTGGIFRNRWKLLRIGVSGQIIRDSTQFFSSFDKKINLIPKTGWSCLSLSFSKSIIFEEVNTCGLNTHKDISLSLRYKIQHYHCQQYHTLTSYCYYYYYYCAAQNLFRVGDLLKSDAKDGSGILNSFLSGYFLQRSNHIISPRIVNFSRGVMADNKYIVGYAKLGTSSCKKCKQKIEKGGLRIGKVTPNPFTDDGGDMKQWFHPKCIFETFVRARATTKKIEDPDDAEGFYDLKDEDKDEIKKLIDGR